LPGIGSIGKRLSSSGTTGSGAIDGLTVDITSLRERFALLSPQLLLIELSVPAGLLALRHRLLLASVPGWFRSWRPPR